MRGEAAGRPPTHASAHVVILYSTHAVPPLLTFKSQGPFLHPPSPPLTPERRAQPHILPLP
jgi:hypothetical protein